MTFFDKLQKAIDKNNSLLCIGLDPDPQKLAKNKSQFDFNKNIIDQTADLVCCYKLNSAFYLAKGLEGLEGLRRTISYLKKNFPHIPIILDAKMADTETTSEMYAKEAFDYLGADAVTVNPYLGEDALLPFAKHKDKGVIVICRSSNPGARDVQDLKVNGQPLYMEVAKKIVSWNKKYQNLFMVVGCTWPGEMKAIRAVAPNMTFLVPGAGAQGGDLAMTLKNGLVGDRGLIISSSRGIIYDQDPRSAAQKLKDEINSFR